MSEPAPSPSHNAIAEAPVEPVNPDLGRPYISNPIDLIKPTIKAFTTNLGTYILGLVATIGFFILVALLAVGAILLPIYRLTSSGSGINSLNPAAAFIPAAILLAAVIVTTILYIQPAMMRLRLAMAHGREVTLGQLLVNTKDVAGRLFWTQLLYSLAVLGGLLLLVVPGLIFAVWYSQATYAAVEDGLSGLAALRRSRQLVRGHFWDTAGTLSLLQAVAALAALVTLIPLFGPILGFFLSAGLAVFSAVMMPLVAGRYLQLKAVHDDSEPVGSTSAWNYVVVFLAFLSFGLSGYQSFTDYQKSPKDQPKPAFSASPASRH